MSVETRVKGGDELARGLARMVDDLPGAVHQATEREAATLADRVRAVVPRLTGAMASSVVVDDTLGPSSVGVAYDGSAPYAAVNDFGDAVRLPYLAEGRYLFPEAASDAAVQAVVEVMERATRTEVEQTRWPNPS